MASAAESGRTQLSGTLFKIKIFGALKI